MRFRYPAAVSCAILLFTGQVEAASVRLIPSVVRGVPVNAIYVRLEDTAVHITAAVAGNGIGSNESFGDFMKRLQPTAAINGTFFCKSSWRPIGDIVIDGRLVYFGGMGTALCVTADNKVEFVRTDFGRHADWSKYRTVIACGPRLITAGAVDVDPYRDGFRDSHVLGGGARTAVGLTYMNRLLLVNTRGGCTLSKLAAIMKDLGCTEAINFDGGASVAMFYRGKMISTPGRKLTNVLLVYENPSTVGAAPQ